MRVQNINTYNPYRTYTSKLNFTSCIKYNEEPEKLSQNTRDLIERVQVSNDYLKKQGYDPLYFHAYYLPQNMNPILEGISVFEGLNMAEVSFILAHMTEIGILRGCYNNCAHCYANANPPAKESDNYISRMNWEDFKSLTEGIKEINSRLGCVTRYAFEPMLLFHDADCSQVYIKDNEGNIHGCPELAKMMYDATGTPVIISTAGWYKEDKAAQQRMEQCVKELTESDNLDYVYNFHISANPYQAMNFKSIQLLKEGKDDLAQYIHQKDVERMANVLFTTTPLLKTGKLKFITRAMSPDSKNSEGFSTNDLKKLWKDYFKELRKLYVDDFNNEQKVIKDEKDIDLNIKKFKKLLYKKGIDTNAVVAEKLSNIYDKEDPATIDSKKLRLNNPKAAIKLPYYYGIVLPNGKFALTNYYETYMTDLQLNFENKNKQTASLNPFMNTEHITKEMINDLDSYVMGAYFKPDDVGQLD